MEPSRREISWTRRDVLLYQLSLGAGPEDLSYAYERGLQVLPTFAMVAGQGVSAGDDVAPSLDLSALGIDLATILHAGQSLTVHRPLPARGDATVESRIADVWDKGKAAVLVLESVAADAAGPLWTSRTQIWARGAGGFGGEPGPEPDGTVPGRQPDHVLDAPTTAGQALLYRLNGDLNPLHADPAFAKRVGFDRPILHGLATYGVVAKALVDGVLDGDATRLTSLSVRFAGTLFPGEMIRTSVWRDGDLLTFVATCPEREDAPVLSHACAEVTP
ncbi:dehydrogenase [Alloactinosynnema sp. L-07]|uniref:MaoC/PaaZ C-terminal domain-containing protein n=1 Tax=Alloactinosynnema sp. L-07 TaxID=1653480 RepID=UPI00065F0A08|nr:MaoC/PaaZ C-terminal domain-containing protein [Alloactinosynnema sp. L-07]CRK57797.1 dehydrogenase [Alloactinosynnema sp. L-07]